MADQTPDPRLWIDVEHGARFGALADSIEMFDLVIDKLGRIRDVWLFATSGAARNRGFCYPLSANGRFGVPTAAGPTMVLIDDTDNQIWLSGPSTQPSGIATARELVQRLGLPVDGVAGEGVVDGCEEIHAVDGTVVGVRTAENGNPRTPPGQTFIRGNRLVNRMEFDKGGAGAVDLRQRGQWRLNREPGWASPPACCCTTANDARTTRGVTVAS